MTRIGVYYEVRCCCSPRKLFGHLNVSRWMAERLEIGRPVTVAMPKGSQLLLLSESTACAHPGVERFILDLKYLHEFVGDRDQSRRAIPSQEKPLEFWRRVPGFEEAGV